MKLSEVLFALALAVVSVATFDVHADEEDKRSVTVLAACQGLSMFMIESMEAAGIPETDRAFVGAILGLRQSLALSRQFGVDAKVTELAGRNWVFLSGTSPHSYERGSAVRTGVQACQSIGAF